MTRRIAGVPPLAWLALGTLVIAGFGRLAAEPSALLVDADHPGVDHARRADVPSAGNDATRLFLPIHLGIADQLARLGRVPAWDDRGFGGRPLVGNPQAGLFYPPVWLAWWSGWPAALGWITVGHLLWAALGTYRLARTLRLDDWAALVAAGCFSMSPYVLAQIFEGHYPHVWAASWYPWAFDAAIRLRRGEAGGRLELPPILAATLLAGHPQEGYYLLIALGGWALGDGLGAIRRGRGREAFGLWARWAGVAALALGLVGVELIPDALAQDWGLRWARLPLRLAGQYHLDPTNALQILGPRALGGPADYFGHGNYWESVTSIGLIPMFLAAIALARSPDRRTVRGWAVLVGSAVVFASGRKLGLFAALYQVVPGMDRFRVPGRSLFLASLGASVLAGLGVEALRAGADDGNPTARRSGAVAAILAAVVLAGRWLAVGRRIDPTGPDRIPEVDRWLLGLARLSAEPTFWLALGGGSLLVAWGRARPRDRRVAAAALGLLGLVELGLDAHALIAIAPAGRFLGPDPIGRALLEHRPDGAGPPRIRAVDALYDDLRAGRLGIAKTNVNDTFQIQHAADLYEPLYLLFDPDRHDFGAPMDSAVSLFRREVRRAVLDRMGVSSLVSDRVDPRSPWPTVASGRWRGTPYAVLRNPTAMPRAYVVPRAEVEPDGPAVVARFREVDPRQAVLMPVDPLGPDRSRRQPFTPAAWDSADPDRVVLRVATEAPGLLVVADTWMPGWTAEVDGRPAPVLRGNRAQRVVPLPDPGPHRVVLRYRPPGLALGLAITAGSAVAWAALVLAGRLRRTSDACH